MSSYFRSWEAFAWPLAGVAVGVALAMSSYKTDITVWTGVGIWCATLLLVLILSAHPIGARAGAILGGVSLVVPCLVWGSPLDRCLQACLAAVPFFGAAMLLRVSPIAGFRARTGYLLTWRHTRPVTRHARRVDVAALKNLVLATSVLGAAFAIFKAASQFSVPLPVRWLAGGTAIFAFGEIFSAGLPLVSTAIGVDVPQLFDSPFRSASVGEFWTKRWNIAVSQILRTCCFKPIARRSVPLALFATFLLSGLAHMLLALLALGDWDISLICGVFFMAQPLLITAERRLDVRRWPRAMRHAWTLSSLALTCPLIVEPGFEIIERSWNPTESFIVPTIVALAGVMIFTTGVALASFWAIGSVNEQQQRTAALQNVSD